MNAIFSRMARSRAIGPFSPHWKSSAAASVVVGQGRQAAGDDNCEHSVANYDRVVTGLGFFFKPARGLLILTRLTASPIRVYGPTLWLSQ